MSTRRVFMVGSAGAGLTAAAASDIELAMAQAPSTPKTMMKTYKIPRTDLEVSRIAYGTAMVGDSLGGAEFIERTVRGIRTAYDNGITLFDFADIYGGGESETAMGQVLKASK